MGFVTSCHWYLNWLAASFCADREVAGSNLHHYKFVRCLESQVQLAHQGLSWEHHFRFATSRNSRNAISKHWVRALLLKQGQDSSHLVSAPDDKSVTCLSQFVKLIMYIRTFVTPTPWPLSKISYYHRIILLHPLRQANERCLYAFVQRRKILLGTVPSI